MSVFNAMSPTARIYCVVMAVVGLFTLLVLGGRVYLNGHIFAHNPHHEIVVAGAEEEMVIAAAPSGPNPNDILPEGFVADPIKGQKISAKCMACHTFDAGGKHRTGPNLWNIFGASLAAKDGFAYSKALADKAQEQIWNEEDQASISKSIVWNEEELDAFLKKPKAYISGTKMAFAGIRSKEDRANLIAWLKTLQ